MLCSHGVSLCVLLFLVVVVGGGSGTWVEAPKDPNDSRRAHQPVKEGLQGSVIRYARDTDMTHTATRHLRTRARAGVYTQLTANSL